MINDKKICAIIQAREGSSRLPGKALVDICGKPALQHVIERTRGAKLLDDIIVATTENEKDNVIIELCEKLSCSYFRGSENNVLDRVLSAARQFEVDVICEITADCPMIDRNHIDTLIKMHMDSDCDMTSNIIERTFPRGYDIRVFNKEALERANDEVDNAVDRSHVSTWLYLNPKGKQNYNVRNWFAPRWQDRPDIEVTLDTPEDLELIRWLFEYGKEYVMEMNCEQVINALDAYPHIYQKVKKIQRKDYFEELKEAYKGKKGAKDEKVETDDNRVRETGRRGRPAKKRKQNH